MQLSKLSNIAGASVLMLAASFVGTANAQVTTPSPTVAPYANGITAPGGIVDVHGTMWVSDHLQGFCRLDPVAATPGGVAINASTCVTTATSPGQPSFDPSNNYVYIPDNSSKSRGVWRLKYAPAATGAPGRFITSATATVANRPTLVASLGSRPTATVLANGALYIGAIKNGNITRVTNPGTATRTVATVGRSSDGGGVAGLTFLNDNLYLAEGAGVSVIGTPSTCIAGQPANCQASILTSQYIAGPTGITSDGSSLYVGDVTNEVIKYTPGTDPDFPEGTEEIYVPGGSFRLISGLGMNTDRTKLFVGDDPTDGNGVAQGHVYSVTPAPATP